MHNEGDYNEITKGWHGTLTAYFIGFGASIFLTCIAFALVAFRHENFPDTALILTLIGLALMQAAAQVMFFLHLGEEAKPRWETLVFCFMTVVLTIVVLGSLWIMFDLKNRLMPM